MESQTRWKQRFQNFAKAYALLKKFSESEYPEEMEQMARIQAFEICFELSWKVLKDYFYDEGIIINSPRGIIKQAVQNGIFTEGRVWVEALDSRNTTSHAYDEEIAEDISHDIRDEYLEIFEELYEFFQKKI